MLNTFIPWLLAGATGVWFGSMAGKAKRSPISWAFSGTLFGLVTATIVWGVGHAMTIVYAESEYALLNVKCAVVAAALIGVIGWLFTGGLHRHLLSWLKPKAAGPITVPGVGGPTAGSKPEAPRAGGRR